MEKVFDIIKNSTYTKIRIPFDDEEQEVTEIIKILNHYDVIDIIASDYNYFTISKTKIFDEIVLKYDSNFDKQLENKEYKEELNHKEVLANISAANSEKSSNYATWGATIVAILAFIFSIYQSLKANEYGEKYDKAKNSIDNLTKAQEKMKIRNKDLEDSLKVLKRKP